MNNNGIIGFVVGAAVGSVVTYILTKKSFEQQAQAEIDNIRKMYKEELKRVNGEPCEERSENPKPDIPAKRPYMDKPSPIDYAKMNNIALEQEYIAPEAQHPVIDIPYVVPPDEVGDPDGYRCEDLIYFADGVLTDDNEEPIDDPNALVGPIALNSFGEYEDDTVCVRNNARQCDYVIMRDDREYYATH